MMSCPLLAWQQQASSHLADGQAWCHLAYAQPRHLSRKMEGSRWLAYQKQSDMCFRVVRDALSRLLTENLTGHPARETPRLMRARGT